MYRIALILNGRVQHVGNYNTLPQFAPPLVTVDITDYEGEVKEGYLYDAKSEVFTESTTPVPEEPVTPEPDPKPTLEQVAEETLLETKYQTLLLEIMM